MQYNCQKCEQMENHMFLKTEKIAELEIKVKSLEKELQDARVLETQWKDQQKQIMQQLKEIEYNYAKYAHYYGQYFEIKHQLQKTQADRIRDGKDFQSKVLEILKEFQPFQEHYEQANRNKFYL